MTGATLDAAVLSAVFDSAADAMMVMDRDGRVLRVNAAALRLFGHDSAEILGVPFAQLVPPLPGAPQDAGMAGYGTEGREVEGCRKDGGRFPAWLSVGRVEREDGPLHVGILHDLSRRRAMERVLERARRMESVGRLSGTIAHDFKNMLTVIIGNLELLESRLPAGAENEMIHDALDAAQTGVDLTESLMGFSTRRKLAPRRVEINAIVERGSTLLKPSLGSGIDISLRLLPDLWPVKADPSQLRSTLINLVLNAKEAMPEGGQLTIRTDNVVVDDDFLARELDMRPGRYARISVCDTGIGMDEETQLRAFEPLFTTKQKSGGMGLGLASVYGFVRHSGGQATIYSEPGAGTTVNLYFPAVEVSEGTAPRPDAADRRGGRQKQRQRKGQTVLVVDDRPELLRSTMTRLEALGYAALGAGGPDEAVKLLEGRKDIALVLTDVVMGDKPSGIDLAECIRERFPKVRTILSSGAAQDPGSWARAECAACHILRKPYRQVELAARLDRLLGQGPG